MIACDFVKRKRGPDSDKWRRCRVKVLKRYAQLAVTLAPATLRRSMLVDDIVGMSIAGLAMAFALVTMFWAFHSSAQFGILYIAIYIIGYMFKVPCAADMSSVLLNKLGRHGFPRLVLNTSLA